eukprot:GHVS01061058.1.p1 GENE.GHVS01061058.1~~GHVS01061058.1.p1  ORF type:complete len:247 (+),score=49.97 GHVS01061058.1:600-1340(+)
MAVILLLARACLFISAFCMFFLSVLGLLLLQHAETIEIADTKKSKAGVSCMLCVVLYAGVAYLSYAYIRGAKNNTGRRGRRGRAQFASDRETLGFVSRGRRGLADAWEIVSNMIQPGSSRSPRSRRRRSSWNEHLSDVTNGDDLAYFDDDDSHRRQHLARTSRTLGGSQYTPVVVAGRTELSTVIGKPVGPTRSGSNDSGDLSQVELRPLMGAPARHQQGHSSEDDTELRPTGAASTGGGDGANFY